MRAQSSRLSSSFAWDLLRSLSRAGGRRGSVACAPGAQRIGKTEVPLVTRVLEDLVVGLSVQWNRHSPRRSEDLRILDRGFVVDRVLIDARKALDDVQLFALRNRSHPLGGHVGG